MLKWTRRLLAGFNVLSWGLGILLIVQAIAINTVAHDRVIRGMAARGMPFGEELIQIASLLAFLLPVMIIIVHVICRKLIAIIDSVGSNAVFSLDNAVRLRAIGWAMLAIQILDSIMGLGVPLIGPNADQYWHWNIGVTGWFAALLLFVLAKVFEQGAVMRDELDGTI